MARRIMSVLEDPIITVKPVSVQVKASIGIAPWDPDGPAAELVERADRAMYAAKRSEKKKR